LILLVNPDAFCSSSCTEHLSAVDFMVRFWPECHSLKTAGSIAFDFYRLKNTNVWFFLAKQKAGESSYKKLLYNYYYRTHQG
jgi:hypothetical protein